VILVALELPGSFLDMNALLYRSFGIWRNGTMKEKMDSSWVSRRFILESQM
jgi:hypothetical protein